MNRTTPRATGRLGLAIAACLALTGSTATPAIDFDLPREVGRSHTIRGTATALPRGSHVWIFVRRSDFDGFWYPQKPVSVHPTTDRWQARGIHFGEARDIGFEFDVSIAAFSDREHQQLAAYRARAMRTGDWRPIELPKMIGAPTMRTAVKVSH